MLVGTLVSLLVNTAHPLTNTDTYFHLRFGHEFLHRWSLRHPGSVSTFATSDWVPTQWLSEVVMAKTEDWFGLAGVAWLSGLLEVMLFLGVYASARLRAEPLVAMPLTALALYAMQSGLSMRPQVVSYLAAAVVVAVWLRTLDDHRMRWWLVPLVWLWAMLHGMWPVALMVGALSAVGLALDRAPRAVVLRAAAVTGACAVAAALTPVGPAVYGAVAQVGSRTSYFAEWLPPDWISWDSAGFAVLLAVTLVGLWRRGHNSWTETLLIVLAGVFGAYSVRTVPLGAAMLAALAAVPLQALVTRGTPPPRATGREVRGILAAAAAALVVLGLLVPHTASEPLAEPAWTGPALGSLPPGTKVLDDWALGGYLMWRYPRLDLVMHGYGDTFTTAELDRNDGLITLAPGWQHALHLTGARVAVLRPWSALAQDLIAQEGWQVEHRSPTLEMLRAPNTWHSPTPATAPHF
ncbi:MAG TPA: hypothetical protein VHW64_11210 [Nocardioides sp.]|uniref:hypothetical protein n=1 Tax=Nocardioides sp. TaxID=35761 RepID=UPI002E32EDB2|nr:hypothetical protein [Nocardioides sp.]HEX3931269.1 hypothetical protein [Nocardioides sp.]